MSFSSSTYKPSPLYFNSPRQSPFRRPESPSHSPSLGLRPSTPTHQSNRPLTPSKLQNSATPVADATFSTRSQQIGTPRELPPSPTRQPRRLTIPPTSDDDAPNASSPADPPARSEAQQRKSTFGTPRTVINTSTSNGVAAAPTPPPPQNLDALSRLPPAQVREMREAFTLLDRSSSGSVSREDVNEMLSQVGLTTPANSFFPASTPYPLPLASYLSQLSNLLTPLGQPQELLSALSAFDDDDSGQVDIEELRDALLNTAPEPGCKPLASAEVDAVVGDWSGRRAFGTGGKRAGRGDVFRYREWVAGLGPLGTAEKAA